MSKSIYSIVIAVILAISFGKTNSSNAETVFTLINEKIYDAPIKTQIEQHFLAKTPPSKDELRNKLLEFYHAARKRSGFRYHENPTNIFIYIYGSKEQAEAEQGLWIGMIAKGFSEKGTPKASISDSRLHAMSQSPQMRFGLTESERKSVFREVGKADEKATNDAMSQIPSSQLMKQLTLEKQLREKYRNIIKNKYNLNDEKITQIDLEGLKKGWPLR